MWSIVASVIFILLTSSPKCFHFADSLKLKSKVLIVSVDNRKLNKNIDSNDCVTMTAVTNNNYAKYHGYDFMLLQSNIDNLLTDVAKKYFHHNEEDTDPDLHVNNAKDAATAFHVGLLQYRAASWAKLPPLWYISKEIGSKYDYILYLDSDACISPIHQSISIDMLIAANGDQVIRGNSNITDSSFIFFSNFPWRDDMPCAGVFLFKPNTVSEGILRE